MEELRNYQDIIREGDVFTVYSKNEPALTFYTSYLKESSLYEDSPEVLHVLDILDDDGNSLDNGTQEDLFSSHKDIFLKMITEELYQIRRKN